MSYIAVIGITKSEAAAYADERKLPQPRAYFSVGRGMEGIIAMATVVTPEASRLMTPEMIRACTINSIKAMAPAIVIGTRHG